MPQVKFIRPTGVIVNVEVPVGETLMRSATHAGLDEIVAECGGHLACGTCHVYVGERWLSACTTMTEYEDMMLDTVVAPRLPESRLSCQLVMSDALDQAEVRIASPQV